MQFTLTNLTSMMFSLCLLMNCRNTSLTSSKPIRETSKNHTDEVDNEPVVARVETKATIIKPETNETKPEPVKLTVKQGITMNQILSVYALSDASDQRCKNHSSEFANGLRAFRPWALKMFDSSSKLQSGILLGNLVEYGSFQQCLEIYENTDSGVIRGKHCNLKIVPSLKLIKTILSYRNISEQRFKKVYIFVQNSTFDWSVCVPDSCDHKEVLTHFEKVVYSLSEGLDITVTLEEEDCYTIFSDKPLTTIEWAVIGSFAAFIGVLVICTIIDTYMIEEEALKHNLIIIFSLWRNSKEIFSKNKGDQTLDCVHGIRFLSTSYVIIGHRYLMMMFFPVINSLQIMTWVLYYRSTVITGGTLCVDSFFMISGMLVSLGYFKLLEKTGRMNWAMFYIYRYLRITPPLAVVVLWYSTLIQHFGSGPLWNDMLDIIQKPCQEYWWATILHIQNYVHPFPLCMTQTWYLTCDMQYYFLSPFLLIALSKGTVIGGMVCFAAFVGSIAINFYLAWIHEYSGGVPVTNSLFSTKYFQYHYITPHTRASTYIIGLVLGYVIHKTRNIKVEMSYLTVILGWILCVVVMLASLVGCHSFHAEESVYNRFESSIFLSFSRSAWTFGVVWVVWACIKGHGGPINVILSHHTFRVLGKISYGMYLLHMQMQYMMSGARKQPGYFSDFDALYSSFADLFIMVIIGFIFTVCFESPLIKLLSIFILGGAAKKKINPNVNTKVIDVKEQQLKEKNKEKLFTVT